MNRAERRRFQKKGITAKDLKMIEEASAKDAINYTTNAMIASFAICLHDKWGWGKVRLKRLLDQVNETFDCINKDYVTIEDIKKAIFKETGILIK